MIDREQECFYCIALTQIPHIGIRGGKRLYDAVGSATDIFLHREELCDKIPSLRPKVIKWLDCVDAFRIAENEMNFIKTNDICFYTLNDSNYPSRFHDCDDASIILFSKGNFDLNTSHVLNVVGTRKATEYGKQFCIDFVRELKNSCPDVIIVSGLAYGIDISAHCAALNNNISTVGVLAHGLDRIYPSMHRTTAIKMLQRGGLLTEFISGTNPDPYNFVSRNRIIAGVSDATVVVESAAKGGALITAEIAESYHRDCFAVPGRIGDCYSIGCNKLICDNKASVFYNTEDFIKAMRWGDYVGGGEKNIQRNFFPQLSEAEKKIVGLLETRGDLQINTLAVEIDIPVHKISSILFELEIRGVIRTLAGGMYQLL